MRVDVHLLACSGAEVTNTQWKGGVREAAEDMDEKIIQSFQSQFL